MRQWIIWNLRHRRLVMSLVVACTALACWQCSQAVVASSVAKLFLGESQDYLRYKVEVARFGSDELILVGLDVTDPLEPSTVERLQNAIDELYAIEDVARVDSFLGAQRITAIEDGVQIKSWRDIAEDSSAVERAHILPQMLTSTDVASIFASADGLKLGVVVELKVDPDRPAEQGPNLVKSVEACFVEAGFRPDTLHKAGMLPVFADVIEASVDNLIRLFPVVTLVLLLTVFALFRGFVPVVVTMGVTLIAVIWTFGLSTWLDPHVSIMQTAVPAVILIVGFSDIIHLYSAYLLELQAGQQQREAIISSSAEVGRACLFTSLTTFIGFVSLSLVPTPAFRHLGLVLGFGVAVALLLAVTATPIALLWLPRPPLDSKRNQSRVVKDLVRWCQDTALSSPRWVIGVFFVLTVVAGVGVSRLHIDTDMIQRLPEQGRTQRDARWFSESFAGTGTVEIYINSGTQGGALDPGLLAAVARFQDAVERIDGVDQVASFVTLIERMHEALGGQGRLPKSRAAVAQELLLFEMRGGKNLERMVDFDRQRLRIGVRLQATAMRQTYEAAEQIRAVAAKTLPPRVSVEVTGLGALLGAWLDQILSGQLRGLALSILTITLMMSWMVRSLRVGLWSMVPNLLPLWFLGGYAGWRWDAVDSDMIFVAMLAIGIGVDDTIHFLSRYRIESNRNTDDSAALRRTFRFAGRAIVMTTIILVAGHLPFASSAYLSTRILGTLLPMCMIVALVADLLLVPAMVRVGWMSLSSSGPPSDATSTSVV